MKFFPSKRQWQRWSLSSRVSFIGAIFATIAGSLSIILIIPTVRNLIKPNENIADNRPYSAVIDEQKIFLIIDSIENRISSLENFYFLEDSWFSSSRPSELSIDSLPDYKLKNQVEELSQMMESINSAIIDSPEEILALPLVKRDLTSFRNEYESEISSLRSEIQRVYDLTKWFIGLLFALAVGLLSLGLGSFMQTRKIQARTEEENDAIVNQ